MLAADPLQIGAVYIEEDLGSDLQGDTFEVTFQGGAAGTELTRLVFDTDQGDPGFGEGDVIFDTLPSGLGTDNAFGFTVVSLSTQDPAAVVEATVEDGSTNLTLDLSGFRAGDKLVFEIDVDEIEDYDPNETDPIIIADGIDPITSGVEFQSSVLTASFTAPHYHDITGSGEFRNRYDEQLVGTGLNLPEDNHNGLRDRTDGVVIGLQQQPLPVAISGTVFLDHDLDLRQDGSEQGLEAVELGLWRKDGQEYEFTGHTALTDSNGDFSFGFELNLQPGTFQVRETQPSGLFSVGAVPGTVIGAPTGSVAVGDPDRLTGIELPLGGQQAVDFDFAEARPAELSGFVFHDRNDDGLRDDGEEGIAGVGVQVIPLDVIAAQETVSLTTDAQGFYRAAGLAPGQYRIVEPLQPLGFFDGSDVAGNVAGEPQGAASNPGDSIEGISLLGGDAGHEYNFGELRPAAIMGQVHLSDADGNCFDGAAGGAPLAAVTVRLLDEQGNVLRTTQTDAEGRYQFDNLKPGVYAVGEETPAGLFNGTAHVGAVEAVAVGQQSEGELIADIALGSGQTGVGYNFCEHSPASVSGHVFHDADNDGLFGVSEQPIAGVEVMLRDESGAEIAAALTDEFGFYEFAGLPAGEYSIVQTHPSGWIDGQDSVGQIAGIAIGAAAAAGDELSQIELHWGDQGSDYDFGELLPVRIGGSVYHDRNNNGVREAGEEGLAGVPVQVIPTAPFAPQAAVTVFTDTQGMYATGELAPGRYRILEAEQPAGFFDGIDTAGTVNGVPQGSAADAGDEFVEILLHSAQQGAEYNFGELAPVAIGGFVFHDRNNDGVRDPGEEGLADVPVRIIPVDTVAAQDPVNAVTDAEGRYFVDGLSPGSYGIVEAEQPIGFFDGLDAVGTVDGLPQGSAANPGDELVEIVLHSGQQGAEYNFGELAPVAIGGFVFHDRNNDGVRDPGEEGLAGVPIQISPIDTIAAQDPVNAVTDAEGRYFVDGLSPGSYGIVEAEQPIGFFDGLDTAGTVDGLPRGMVTPIGDSIEGIQLASGEQGVEFNFGELAPASIQGRVHLSGPDPQCIGPDVDQDGVAGALVRLLDDAGQLVAEARTDEDGNYEFNGLFPGTYGLVEITPDGLIDGPEHIGHVAGTRLGQQTANDTVHGIRLAAGQRAVGFDFCEHQPASLSGHVFHDQNNNGRRDIIEEAIAGTRVDLVDDAGQVVQTQLTDESGRYAFGRVHAGVYSVVEHQPDGWLDGQDIAGTVDEAPMGLLGDGGDRIDQVTLKWGQAGVNFDFGELQAGSIGGVVHADPNQNCQFEIGEQGIGGVTIRLLDAAGTTIASTVTDANGHYEFGGLAPGSYAVAEVQPVGFFHGGQRTETLGGDVATDDLIANLEVNSGERLLNNNFCEVPPSSLAGIVHVDIDRDCQLDPGESGIAGVTVQLIDHTGSLVASTQTNEQGEYLFEDLPAGQYSIRELQPDNFFHGGQQLGFSGGQVAGDDLLTLDLGAGQDLVGYNFCEAPSSRLSGFVFQDGPPLVTPDGLPPANLAAVRDGAKTDDDVAISGAVLELRDGLSGEPIMAHDALPGYYPAGPIRATTDANGLYEFAGIPGGRNYSVFQIQPEGFSDGLDTPGTTSGLAMNPGSILPLFLQTQLVSNPGNDAILLIPLAVGEHSENNNFSEVLVEAQPTVFIPPTTPDPPGPSIPPSATPPLVNPPAPFLGINRPGISFPYSSDGPTLLVGGAGMPYSWHLSVINAGVPRGAESADEVHVGSWYSANYLGVVRWRPEDLQDAQWTLGRGDASGRQTSTFAFGIFGGVPVAGDFNGDGVDEIGVYFGGEWFLDLNGDGRWDERDVWAKLGDDHDLPVIGDWDGDGKDDLGIFGPEWLGDSDAIELEPGLPDTANARRDGAKNLPPKSQEAADGFRLMQLHETGARRADVIDHVFRYGEARDLPIAGDWNGDGIRAIGIFRDGQWQLDADGDGRLTRHDASVTFGQSGDLPVVGDFNGDGVEEIGVYRNGTWYLDVNRNYELDAHDKVFEMGGAADVPVAGDWDGDGTDEPGLYRPGRPAAGEAP